MQISAKVDYALRALLELANHDGPMTGDAVAAAQDLPVKYLGAVLNDLRRAGYITSHRGLSSGYRLARPARRITVAEIVQAIDGPLIQVRGLPPDEVSYSGAARHLAGVWTSVEASLTSAMGTMTLEDVVQGKKRIAS